jgi:hypothetical protein
VSEHLRLDLAGPVATLTIDRPAKTIVNRIAGGQVDEDQTVRALYAASVTSADYAEGARFLGEAAGEVQLGIA